MGFEHRLKQIEDQLKVLGERQDQFAEYYHRDTNTVVLKGPTGLILLPDNGRGTDRNSLPEPPPEIIERINHTSSTHTRGE